MFRVCLERVRRSVASLSLLNSRLEAEKEEHRADWQLALNAPYSSPAIARRRRGRPPKTPLPIRHLFAKSKPQNASRLSEVHTSTEEDSRAAEEFLARLTDAEAASSRSEVQQGRLQGQGQGDHHLRNVYTSAQASTSPQVDLSTAAYGLGGHLNGDDSDVGDHDKTENGKVVMAAGAGCEICHRTQTTVWRKTVSDGVEKKVCNGEWILTFARPLITKWLEMGV